MSGYSVTCKTTKIAWRRDPSVPAGQPALGSFRCVCGNTITGVSFGSEQDNLCQCGRVWDGRGWLVSEPSPHELRMQAVREHNPAVQDGPYAYIHEDKF